MPPGTLCDTDIFMRWKLPAALVLCALPASAQNGGGPTHETLSYLIEWRLFNAGRARMNLTSTPAPHPGHEVRLQLDSTGIVSKLFKVEDEYLANLDAGYCSTSLQMNIHEGNRLREAKVTFDAETKRAS